MSGWSSTACKDGVMGTLVLSVAIIHHHFSGHNLSISLRWGSGNAQCGHDWGASGTLIREPGQPEGEGSESKKERDRSRERQRALVRENHNAVGVLSRSADLYVVILILVLVYLLLYFY